jgi:hypothetical protein
MWSEELEKRAAEMKARNLAGERSRRRFAKPDVPEAATEPVKPPEPPPVRQIKSTPRHKIHSDVPIRLIPELRWRRLDMGELEQYDVLVFPAPDGNAILYEGHYDSRVFGEQTWRIRNAEEHSDWVLDVKSGTVVAELVNWKLWAVTFVGQASGTPYRDIHGRVTYIESEANVDRVAVYKGSTPNLNFDAECSAALERVKELRRSKYWLEDFLLQLPRFVALPVDIVSKVFHIYRAKRIIDCNDRSRVFTFDEKIDEVRGLFKNTFITDSDLRELGSAISQYLFPKVPSQEVVVGSPDSPWKK